jgi:hypothetical protein
MTIATTIIRDEHRALASVIKGLQFLVQEIQNRGQTPDFPLLQSIVSYIEQFPDRLHHPKEDQYLFPALRLRHPAAAAELDILEDEHARGTPLTARVASTLRGVAADAAGLARVPSSLAGRYALLEATSSVPTTPAPISSIGSTSTAVGLAAASTAASPAASVGASAAASPAISISTSVSPT